MSQVTDPILLDSTGQDMVTQLAAISARLAAGLPGPYAGNPAMDGTASPGSSTMWARGDHVHPSDTSKQDVLTFDTTPISGSSNPVTSGGIYDAVQTRLPKYGMGKNLLDNWYFGNPVNQRGQSSYSTDGAYTIDRWKLGGAVGTANFDSTGVLMSDKTLIGNWFEASRVISGATYTISALWSNGLITATGTLTIGAGISGWQITYGTPTDPRTISIRQVNASTLQFILVGDGTNKAIAAKVELGTEQTLCHNEGTAEAPVWVLNEIPDYGEELRKCQRYFIALLPNGSTPLVGNGICISTTQATIMIPTPVTMRSSTPTITYSGTLKLWHGSVYGSSAPNLTAIVDPAVGSNGISTTIQVASGLVAGESAMLQLRDNSPAIYISCEL